MPRILRVEQEAWPIAGSFRISRGAKTESNVVVVEITDGDHRGRGECVPYARYGETVEGVMGAIKAQAEALEAGIGRHDLQSLMPPGAARNAVDCALWDLDAKQSGTTVWQLAGLNRMSPVTTAYTLSLDTPDGMAGAARDASNRPLIKVKLGLGRRRGTAPRHPRGSPQFQADHRCQRRLVEEPDRAVVRALRGGRRHADRTAPPRR